MPLLEIIPGEQTDDAALATAFATGKTLGKTTILVKDSASFITNRLLGRFMGEYSKIVDEGTPIEVADEAVAGLAPMPPFVLMGLVGPTIALHNSETLHRAFGDRFYVSPNLVKMVEAKKAGYYLWDTGVPVPDPEVVAMQITPEHPVALTAPQARERILGVIAEEIRLMLDEGVAQAAQDIDLAMITGAGFQFWNGGVTPLLDREGISEKFAGGRFHPAGVASVPA
jgi:3-hydroxyacyl-CoA dehydrogenase